MESAETGTVKDKSRGLSSRFYHRELRPIRNLSESLETFLTAGDPE